MNSLWAGGGTGKMVAEKFGLTNSVHLDLNPTGGGWNALMDEMPNGSDFVFSHPPYHSMIVYSGQQWGEAHKDDLSRCSSYEEFINKLNLVNSKIYHSLVNGGRHAMLIGDMRKKGVYYSMIKDLAWYSDIESHIIKAQHNTVSGRKAYTNNNFIPIAHEHLLIFRKNQIWAVPVKQTKSMVLSLLQSTLVTWRDLVQAVMQHLGGKANLSQLYQLIEKAAKTKNNSNWKAKVRQTLQLHSQFRAVEKGLWSLDIANADMPQHTAV